MDMVSYRTKMEKIPPSCAECECCGQNWCSLPLKRRRCEAVVKKEYETRRHKDCPLMENSMDERK
jgi:hypothetical protein